MIMKVETFYILEYGSNNVQQIQVAASYKCKSLLSNI